MSVESCFVCDCNVEEHVVKLTSWLQVISLDPEIVQAGIVYCNICKDTCAVNTINADALLSLIRGSNDTEIIVPGVKTFDASAEDWLDPEDDDEDDEYDGEEEEELPDGW